MRNSGLGKNRTGWKPSPVQLDATGKGAAPTNNSPMGTLYGQAKSPSIDLMKTIIPTHDSQGGKLEAGMPKKRKG